MIRTSGENRISNFMLWQLAYAEFYFSNVHWPDFREEHFIEALIDYQIETDALEESRKEKINESN